MLERGDSAREIVLVGVAVSDEPCYSAGICVDVVMGIDRRQRIEVAAYRKAIVGLRARSEGNGVREATVVVTTAISVVFVCSKVGSRSAIIETNLNTSVDTWTAVREVKEFVVARASGFKLRLVDIDRPGVIAARDAIVQ